MAQPAKSPSCDYQLRPVARADREYLWQLTQDSYRDHIDNLWGWDDAWQREHFVTRLEDTSSAHHIIEVDSRPVGYLELRHDEICIQINNIEITPARQGQGLGAKLIQDLKKQALFEGKSVFLQVFKINTRAAAFYVQMGFVTEGSNETHYLMRWTPETQTV